MHDWYSNDVTSPEMVSSKIKTNENNKNTQNIFKHLCTFFRLYCQCKQPAPSSAWPTVHNQYMNICRVNTRRKKCIFAYAYLQPVYLW